MRKSKLITSQFRFNASQTARLEQLCDDTGRYPDTAQKRALAQQLGVELRSVHVSTQSFFHFAHRCLCSLTNCVRTGSRPSAALPLLSLLPVLLLLLLLLLALLLVLVLLLLPPVQPVKPPSLLLLLPFLFSPVLLLLLLSLPLPLMLALYLLVPVSLFMLPSSTLVMARLPDMPPRRSSLRLSQVSRPNSRTTSWPRSITPSERWRQPTSSSKMPDVTSRRLFRSSSKFSARSLKSSTRSPVMRPSTTMIPPRPLPKPPHAWDEGVTCGSILDFSHGGWVGI